MRPYGATFLASLLPAPRTRDIARAVRFLRDTILQVICYGVWYDARLFIDLSTKTHANSGYRYRDRGLLVALWNDGTVNAHFELCPREHTQRILPMVQDILTTSGTSLTDINALAYGRGPGSFTGVRIGIGIAQGLALGAELPMIGVSTLMTMAQGAWRKNGATRVLSAIDARMVEVYWAEYQRDENGIWHGEETEAVLKPELVHERMQQLSGEWVTVGTGWQAWPDLGKESGLVLRDGRKFTARCRRYAADCLSDVCRG